MILEQAHEDSILYASERLWGEKAETNMAFIETNNERNQWITSRPVAEEEEQQW